MRQKLAERRQQGLCVALGAAHVFGLSRIARALALQALRGGVLVRERQLVRLE
jgi:hypothetical protein